MAGPNASNGRRHPGNQVAPSANRLLIEYQEVGGFGDDLRAERGWFVGRSVDPEAVHLMIDPVHAPFPQYLGDLRQYVEQARTDTFGVS